MTEKERPSLSREELADMAAAVGERMDKHIDGVWDELHEAFEKGGDPEEIATIRRHLERGNLLRRAVQVSEPRHRLEGTKQEIDNLPVTEEPAEND